MKYKVGDLVIHKDSPQTERRIRRVHGEMVLLWGFYEYVSAEDIDPIKLRGEELHIETRGNRNDK